MKIPEEITILIKEEQIRQQGNFVPAGNDYLEKLSEKAELFSHTYNKKISGFIFFYCNDQEKNSTYITLIMVVPSSRGKGVGKILIEHVIEFSRKKGFSKCQLEVLKENITAIRLYESMGFVQVENRGEKFLMEFSLSK